VNSNKAPSQFTQSTGVGSRRKKKSRLGRLSKVGRKRGAAGSLTTMQPETTTEAKNDYTGKGELPEKRRN